MEVAVEMTHEGVPWLRLPEPFNASEWLIDRHVKEGRGRKTAIRTLGRNVTYLELFETVNRYANAMTELGLRRGDRLLLVLQDLPEFFYVFWGAVKSGVIPIPLNVMAGAHNFEFSIRHSRCAGIVYSADCAHEVETALKACPWKPRVALRQEGQGRSMASLAGEASAKFQAVATRADDDCYFLYSSGTTGQPKCIVHAHGDIAAICQMYSVQVLGACEDDAFFSVPRLFFSYGLGVAMTAPLWVGATAVLDSRRPTPQTVLEVFRGCRPTVFASVPTFHALLLASGLLTRDDVRSLRCCISAAEAMPAELHRRWADATGVPVIEGIGSTEGGHIYISNRIGDIRLGAAGKPVPGYQLRIVDEAGNNLPDGVPGRLLIKGQAVLRRFWADPERTARTIVDGWCDTGDTCVRDADGYYTYCGRSDDMFKVRGRWVSPFEVESTLVQHPKVLEAAVIGRVDESGLVKPEAWVVLKDSDATSEAAAKEISAFCKNRLPSFKFPQWIHVVDSLPKTATGKIQRFKLRMGRQISGAA